MHRKALPFEKKKQKRRKFTVKGSGEEISSSNMDERREFSDRFNGSRKSSINVLAVSKSSNSFDKRN